MSCGCSCGCGAPSNSCCFRIVLPDNPVDAYYVVNINTLGIGVYDSTEGTTFQMRGIYSDSAALTVTLDAGNNAIKLSLDGAAIVADLPQATTTQRGVGETATDAEALAKASITTFVTPSNFAAMGSTTSFAGLVELATNAETQAGVSATLAVTPAGLASVTALIQGTEVWADAVARAAADPDFAGQVGVQLDTDVLYISTGAAVGDFDMPVFMLGNLLNQLPSNTTVDLNGNSLTFHSGGLVLLGSTTNTFGGVYTFDNASVSFSNVTSIDYVSVDLRIAGVQIPANSVLTTTFAGSPTSALKTAFLSTFNTQTGYTNFTNSATLRTGDCSTLTLPQICQIVDTLIRDLKAVLLPAT